MDRYISFGLRPVPTAVYPLSASVTPSSVTLTTTKAQEAWTYLGFNSTPQSIGLRDSSEHILGKDMSREAGEGDLNNRNYVTTSPSPALAFELLPYVRPSVLYIFGEKSHINRPPRRDDKLEVTGTGTGGNGGKNEGRVEAKVILGSSHMLPLEKVSETAQSLARWLEKQMREFEHEKRFHDDYDSGKSTNDQTMLSERWMEYMRKPAGTMRSTKSSL
jgi:hypothetical protein